MGSHLDGEGKCHVLVAYRHSLTWSRLTENASLVTTAMLQATIPAPSSKGDTTLVSPFLSFSLYTVFADAWLSQAPVQPVAWVKAGWTGASEAKVSVDQLLTPVQSADSDTNATILPVLALTQRKTRRTAIHYAVLTCCSHRSESIPKGNPAMNTTKENKTKSKQIKLKQKWECE